MDRNNLYISDISLIIKNIPNINRLYNKSILITGATGMICSAVVDLFFYLNENEKANIKIYLAGRSKERICQRFKYKEIDKDFFFIEYDATVQNNIVDIAVDYIIHGASNADPKAMSNYPVETLLANVVGVKTLLDLLKNNQAKRLLYISSSEVYGRKENNKPYNENDYGFVDVLNPRACYPLGKRAAENLCIAYSKEYNSDIVIVRPGHIYGPTMTATDSRASSQFPRDVLNGNNIIMKSKGEQLRSYCYVLDCASAILSVLVNGEKDNAYNISNKNSIVTIKQMAEAFAEAGNKEIIFQLPSETEQKSYNLMNNSSLTSDKIEALGWKASFDIKTGAEHTIKILETTK